VNRVGKGNRQQKPKKLVVSDNHAVIIKEVFLQIKEVQPIKTWEFPSQEGKARTI